ncbi:hypothetical protein C5167_001449 [Papaver somniferum]|uniref:Uncharacterized protein n=1 Tax=Papaver somniferum TaxID=3469 RepID=A0A4Y7KVC1_PAPSO|nr:hypothetical protein C5167_001449 [Papaver somniferum]
MQVHGRGQTKKVKVADFRRRASMTKQVNRRNQRLALQGEKFTSQARFGPSTDPAGKSLHTKLEASKKRAAAKTLEEESKANSKQTN